MRVAVAIDDAPKVRIALAIVLAFLLWFVFLLKLGEWLGTPSAAPIADRPLEMRVVELETSVAAPVAKTARTAPAPAASPRPPKPAEPPRRSLQQHAAPAIKSNPATQSIAPLQPAPTTSESKPVAEATSHAATSSDEKQSATPSATSSGDTAARSISQPLPELPGDLREQAYQTIATARFVIHVDGSVDVELIKPTPNPRLNQILLQALRKWRYSPAIQGGHPVETRQDVRVHFNVN
ncbi:MAG TPA: energy transducer TonB [Paraburkholderia sp.]|nr:energy transducer TonB [Paraburkholderia sp.]